MAQVRLGVNIYMEGIILHVLQQASGEPQKWVLSLLQGIFHVLTAVTYIMSDPVLISHCVARVGRNRKWKMEMGSRNGNGVKMGSSLL